MRLAILFAAAISAAAQPADRAYAALRARDYDTAIAHFLAAIAAAPARADLRKDLAYTYLKIGETALARDQFREAMRLDPADTTAALEYAFLCYETKQQAEARRIFDRLRRADRPLAHRRTRLPQHRRPPRRRHRRAGNSAIALGADNFSAHFELATLAEQRDDLALAATHYERAWRLLPDRRTVLVDLGRVWKALGRADDANAALLAASRGGEPRAAELARELLPARYPFVPEFRARPRARPRQPRTPPRARLPAAPHGPRRPKPKPSSASSPRTRPTTCSPPPSSASSSTPAASASPPSRSSIASSPATTKSSPTASAPSCACRRSSSPAPQPPARLHRRQGHGRTLPQGRLHEGCAQVPRSRPRSRPRRFRRHAPARLDQQHPAPRSPSPSAGSTSPAEVSDPRIAAEAARAYRNLRAASRALPHLRLALPHVLHPLARRLRLRPGQDRVQPRPPVPPLPQHPPDRRHRAWRRTSPSEASSSPSAWPPVPGAALIAWGEAGTAISYLNRHALPDYRGGIAYARTLRANRRFADNHPRRPLRQPLRPRFPASTPKPAPATAPVYWNVNLTVDARRQDWANFVETGPGLRVPLAESLYLTFNALRGRYLLDSARTARLHRPPRRLLVCLHPLTTSAVAQASWPAQPSSSPGLCSAALLALPGRSPPTPTSPSSPTTPAPGPPSSPPSASSPSPPRARPHLRRAHRRRRPPPNGPPASNAAPS